MNLLKNYIEIPERILQGDFVLKLTEGIAQPQQTLKDYVVTPELVKSFEHSMDFVHAAVRDQSSKAAYLHGSFGSGKSHFMAVLSLMLAGNAQARSIPALAPVVERGNA
jgi:predicted ATPase